MMTKFVYNKGSGNGLKILQTALPLSTSQLVSSPLIGSLILGSYNFIVIVGFFASDWVAEFWLVRALSSIVSPCVGSTFSIRFSRSSGL